MAEPQEQAMQVGESSARSGKKQKSRARKTIGHIVRACVFLLLAFAIFIYGNMAVGHPGEEINEGVWEAFYQEQEDTSDVIYIGTSASSRFFNDVVAFHETGISSYQFGIAGTPPYLYDNLIEYTQQTQHPKVYVIELRPLLFDGKDFKEKNLRRIVDTMRLLDPARVSMYQEGISQMKRYLKKGSYDSSLVNYLFPLIPYHSRLVDGEVTTDQLLLKRQFDPYKGYCFDEKCLTQVPIDEPDYQTGTTELNDFQKETLQDILDCCDKLDAKVLFVASPHKQTEDESKIMNTLCKRVEDAGYDCINFNTDKMIDELGLDFSTDYYNRNHTNYLGAEKYTKWLSNYLVEHYNLEDHRDDATYQSWEDGYQEYKEETADGILYESLDEIEG